MADGTRLNPGEGGDLVLTDDLGSSKVQVNKAAFGEDGAMTMVSNANPMPTEDTAVAGQLTEAVEELSAIVAALGEALTVSVSNEPNVKPVSVPGTAADGAAAPAVNYVLAGYDGSAIQRLVTDASGFLQTDDPQGLEALETLAALLGGVLEVTGAVTVSGVSTAAKQDSQTTVLQEIESGVDGTEALLTTMDANTSNLPGMLTSLQTLDNIVSGSEAQVDIVSGGPLTTAVEAVKSAVEALIAGATIFRSLDIDESEEEVKGTGGRLLFYHYANRTAEELFLKFYNATAANVTVGSTTPVLTLPLAKESQGHVPIPKGGFVFSTAISVACVKGVADSSNTGPAENGCIINLGYA